MNTHLNPSTDGDIHQHSTPLAYPSWRTVVETTSRPRVSKVGPTPNFQTFCTTMFRQGRRRSPPPLHF
ncbi:hypothetical protein HBI56_074180 [Parastagonospora nodorum]|uniref:Uncharacterized protein n=1 Tax=Phaeosphaeria nodorum (strain SN15 / ATCC MYA-4574 / FGSC 10173) TaxID=321614 RepID=A0A7U2HXN8_PHANO|nr:hypothetical protein HBH56_170800 [Parastagonospora nodorum]QRC94483.1 hypothetical protein JI435_405880 [Parastagonospora nodorum SN15]KAH3928607.1 hypothetical protein HBH54_139360 [Parastagonospora nodorum]KAH3945384.1 hypothetical protein HBH53_144710 [Parastagonospora nodorum]KAH3984123.1 hypothetical protein HBH52_059510 [Parastagonospora nodorum]